MLYIKFVWNESQTETHSPRFKKNVILYKDLEVYLFCNALCIGFCTCQSESPASPTGNLQDSDGGLS